MLSLQDDVAFTKDQIVEQKKRKQALQQNLGSMTEMFKKEQSIVTRGQKESQNKLIMAHAQKEILEKEALEAQKQRDRSSRGRKYE